MDVFQTPSFPRRIGALFYDTLLVLAIFIIGTAPLLFITHGNRIPPGNIYYQAYLLFLGSVFFVWFWTHGGQTVGMAAWRLRLVTLSGKPVSVKRALLRLPIAFLLGGVGLFWCLFDKEKFTLTDRLSGTRVILIS